MIHGLLHEHEYSLSEVTHVAYTAGPGLAGALLSGASVALGVAASLGIPAVPVHHIEGHILSPLIGDHPVAFPYLAVLFQEGIAYWCGLLHLESIMCWESLLMMRWESVWIKWPL